jgi:hypothetical protein
MVSCLEAFDPFVPLPLAALKRGRGRGGIFKVGPALAAEMFIGSAPELETLVMDPEFSVNG